MINLKITTGPWERYANCIGPICAVPEGYNASCDSEIYIENKDDEMAVLALPDLYRVYKEAWKLINQILYYTDLPDDFKQLEKAVNEIRAEKYK